MNPLLKLLAAIHGHATDLEILLIAERARRYDADMRHTVALARVDQLEAALTDERNYCAALEHALAGRSWDIAKDGTDG